MRVSHAHLQHEIGTGGVTSFVLIHVLYGPYLAVKRTATTW